MQSGVQLYSLREFIQTNGLEPALSIIAEAGFTGVEFAGFYGKTAEEIQSLLNRYHLHAISAHVGADAIETELPILQALGITCAVIPYIDFNNSVSFEDGLRQCRCAEHILKQNEMILGYHNHAHEFKNGTDIVGRLTEQMPGLKLELDAFWLTVSGISTTNYMRAHSDRLIYLHVKEYGESVDDINPVIGSGNGKLNEVLALGKELNLEWAILEAERIDLPPKEYLQRGYAFMKKYH